jgi:hypothetical protein
MTTTERRDLALAELLPGLYILLLRHGQSDDKGYVLRRNLSPAEATLFMRDILAPGNDTAWLDALLPEPWRVVVLSAAHMRGVFNVVLPAREDGWPA